MNPSAISRFACMRVLSSTETTFQRLATTRWYSAKKGKKNKKGGMIAFDPELAEGLVDFDKIRSNMESTIDKLKHDFTSKITVKTLPDVLDRVRVTTKDGRTPLAELGIIRLKGDNMIVVDMSNSPGDTKPAAQAIKESRVNFEPVVDGHTITVPIPKVTQEYRQNLAKLARQTSEQSKQNLRRLRQKGMSDVRKNKLGRSEDDVKQVEKMIQQLTDEFSSDADLLVEEKTKELLRK